MTESERKELERIKKEIVIERLRQAPNTISVSFGSKEEFMSRDDLIKNIENNTEIGRKIIDIQLTYLRAFKTGAIFGN